MKVLLTQLSVKKHEVQSLGLAYLASYVRKYYDDRIGFAIFCGNVDEVEKKIAEFKPDIVGISSMSSNYNLSKELGAYCKKNGIFVIIGGTHISVLPDTLSEDINLGIIGEGEQTFLEIVREYNENGNKFNYGKINGIVYWENEKLKFTQPRELISDLDTIPFPAWDLLDTKGKDFRIFTSRGCCYNCVFCASANYWRKLRFNSAEYLINAISDIVNNYPVKHIAFSDDLFLVDKKRLETLAELIKKSNFKVTFRCNGRINLIDRETLTLLKEMNVTQIMLGLESGNNRVLQFLKGKTVSLEASQKAVDLIKEFGFTLCSTFIIGSPDETKEEIMDTYNFIKKNINYTFDFFLMSPLPVSDVWNYALKRGKVSKDMDWSILEMRYGNSRDFDNAIILSERLSREELRKIYFKFYRLKKWIEFKYLLRTLLKTGLKHPDRIWNYIAFKLFEKKQSL